MASAVTTAPSRSRGSSRSGRAGPLVGPVRHSLLGQDRAGGVVQGRQEMRRRILIGAGPAHGLAVYRDHCSSFDGAGACVEP